MFIGDVNIWDRSIAFNKFKDYKNKNHFDSRPMMRKIKIIWGLMTIEERDNFIKIRKNEKGFYCALNMQSYAWLSSHKYLIQRLNLTQSR